MKPDFDDPDEPEFLIEEDAVAEPEQVALNRYGLPVSVRTKLVWEANRLLRESGDITLSNSLKWGEPKQMFYPFSYGRVVVGAIRYPSPVATQPYRPPRGRAGSFCAVCNCPRSAGSGAICRECYQTKAKEKLARERQLAAERVERYVERRQWTGHWIHRHHEETEDFAPDLIEEISEREEAVGEPIAFWREMGIDG